jgi:hypothetical protein
MPGNMAWREPPGGARRCLAECGQGCAHLGRFGEQAVAGHARTLEECGWAVGGEACDPCPTCHQRDFANHLTRSHVVYDRLACIYVGEDCL